MVANCASAERRTRAIYELLVGVRMNIERLDGSEPLVLRHFKTLHVHPVKTACSCIMT
jgi:hypothetical protein